VFGRILPLAILVTQSFLSNPAGALPLSAAGAQGGAAASAYRGTSRAYLGAFLWDAQEANQGDGAMIGKVVPESPAAKADLQANDVLLSFDEIALKDAAHVYRLLGELQPGATVRVTYLRGAERQTVPVVLGERQAAPDVCKRLYAETELNEAEALKLRKMADEERLRGKVEEARKLLEESATVAKQAKILREDVDRAIQAGVKGAESCQPGNRNNSRQSFGLATVPLTEQLARFFNVPSGTGVLISEIRPGSTAARNGLKAGDCLASINGKPVSSPAEVNRLLNRQNALVERAVTTAAAELPEMVLVLVREGTPQTVKINPVK
jgi:S1-C subfamily serine protease